ncbi:unnamed protein product [Urochloa decumbens]|uniref:NB-ARC domain-containing protein n=1 Tax=Urochloa decumbens TaxID=240449 RepID=A0ABC9B0S8_9POAL
MVRQVRNMALDVEDCIESAVHFNDESNWWRRMLPSCVPAAVPVAHLDAVITDMELLKARVAAMGDRNMRYNRIGAHGPKPGDEQTHDQQAVANATTFDLFANLRYAAEMQSNQLDLVELINKRDMHLQGKEKEVEKDKGVLNESKVEKQVEEPMHSSPSMATDVLQLQVISVLGTRKELAMMIVKKAYDNEETCQSFTCRAWVKLMHPFNPRAFMQNLLAQFDSNCCREQDDTVVETDGTLIKKEFEKQISNHKYLVVLEDVSTIADMEAARVYLSDNNNGSCIIVHTQLPGTASLCVGHPHRVSELEKFSADHSVYAFYKKSKEEWDMTKAALDLVQTDKKDVVIVTTNKESVAKHCASDHKYVHNVKYLEFDHAMELFKKNQVEGFEFDSDDVRPGIVHKCGGLPKVLCALADNLVFTLEDNSKKGLQRTGRHLAIYESWDRDRNVYESMDFSRLRSITVFGEWKSFFISDKMRLLRVLDLEDGSSGLTNGDIDKIVELLPCLKFLSLRRCRKITHLPDSLGDLKQLQTLDIRETSVTKLPKSIITLEKLQYLRAGSTINMDNDAGMVQDSPPPAEAGNPPSSDTVNGMIEIHPTSSAPPEAENSSDTVNGMIEKSPTLSPPAANTRPGATLVLNWLSKLFIQNRLDDDGHGSHNGVKLPRGIGNLSNMHTLGVVNISPADNEGILDELKNLTQLHKLGVSGINKNNADKLFSAISHLIHLKSLSLHLQRQLNEASCLEGISEETIKRLWGGSLKIYLYKDDCKLPTWTRNFYGHRKLSLHKTKLTQEDMFLLPSLRTGNLRLFLSEFQDGMLHFDRRCSVDVGHLDISCNSSRSDAKITFSGSMHVTVLRIRCPRVSSLQISGLWHLDGLKEVWLCGPCDNDHKEHYWNERDMCHVAEGKSKPVLRLEKPGSSSTPWLVTTTL